MVTVMPLDEPSTSRSPPPGRSRSLLSRLSSPLSKRSSKIFEFEIEPEHPHKTYRPGEVVNGHVVLSVFKGFDITHLTVSLHGYARVFKHQCAPGENKNPPDQLINGKGTHGFQYHGSGLASLFQDEQALCGSGFLKRQVYKFGFELQFPSCSLPSTIEFERGAVNYMVSATVTRPAAMAPTTTRTYKVRFENRIDIESLCAPKPHIVYLEPVTRRGKVKMVKQASSSGTQETVATQALSRQSTSHSLHRRAAGPVPLEDPPLSPAPSEDTVATNATTSTHSLKLLDQLASQQKESDHSEPRSSVTSTSAKTISAITEISRHGALPGDAIAVRVRVEHTKAARGVVIATLYRQGRIDMLPALPVVSRSKGKRPEYEDVYPKSKTGLGSLYFTSSAPNMAFRKDLSQTSTMMIVDPQTKTADVRFAVQIPPEAFPTIDNIPGGMISFTYNIEIVIDLTGKLGEARRLPSLTAGPMFSKAAGGGSQLTHDWANNILDTAPLRRTKNVASFELPIIIGTEDSGRQKRIHPGEPQRQSQQSYESSSGIPDDTRYGSEQSNYPGAYYDDREYDGYDNAWYGEHGHPVYEAWSEPGPLPHPNGYPPRLPHGRYCVPPPDNAEHVDEKTRLRRQEELLLPSQPPDAGEGSSQAPASAPSAPVLDEYVLHAPMRPHPSIPVTISRASARSPETVVPDPLTPPPSLPDDGMSAPPEDKQELERQRLMAQASAPPAEEDDRAGPSRSHHRDGEGASAPVMGEEGEYMSQALQTDGSEHLPQYQR